LLIFGSQRGMLAGAQIVVGNQHASPIFSISLLHSPLRELHPLSERAPLHLHTHSTPARIAPSPRLTPWGHKKTARPALQR
jgi:hypothetical protein